MKEEGTEGGGTGGGGAEGVGWDGEGLEGGVEMKGKGEMEGWGSHTTCNKKK